MSLPAKHFVAALVWVALSAVVYLLVERLAAPKVVSGASGTEIAIPRSRDGHFYVEAGILGQRLDFMIDTGASTTAISAEAALKLGLAGTRPTSLATANGIVQGQEAMVPSLTLGGITVQRVRVVILPDLKGPALLGQNVLKHLELVQRAETLILRRAQTE